MFFICYNIFAARNKGIYFNQKDYKRSLFWIKFGLYWVSFFSAKRSLNIIRHPGFMAAVVLQVIEEDHGLQLDSALSSCYNGHTIHSRITLQLSYIQMSPRPEHASDLFIFILDPIEIGLFSRMPKWATQWIRDVLTLYDCTLAHLA